MRVRTSPRQICACLGLIRIMTVHLLLHFILIVTNSYFSSSSTTYSFNCEDVIVASEAAESLLMLCRGDTTRKDCIREPFSVQQNCGFQDSSSTQTSCNSPQTSYNSPPPYFRKKSSGSRKITNCYERLREMNNAARYREDLNSRLVQFL